jgi:hypothetical protein
MEKRKRMTNKQFLVAEIKKMLDGDDLTADQRIRLLRLLAKHVPPTRKHKARKPVRRASTPFQRPS